jgi:hypothetical protein
MFYNKYLIKDSDHFEPMDFPQLMDDLDTIQAAIAETPETSRSEMLLTFLKEHSLGKDLIASNPRLASMITSGTLPLSGLQALFDSCRKHTSFGNQLENHIRLSCRGARVS